MATNTKISSGIKLVQRRNCGDNSKLVLEVGFKYSSDPSRV